jgi:hypothetical protein
MFQLSGMLQSHAALGRLQDISVPGNAEVNPIENLNVLWFSGWRE